MTKDRNASVELRERAVAQLRMENPKRTGGAAARMDPERMLYELEVQRAELEIQNEELRGTRSELEVALARYTDLFDCAPIGYATLSATGIIRELNHSGARLLGKPRSRVIGKPFALYLAAGSNELFFALLRRAGYCDSHPSCEIDLSIDGRLVSVRLTATEVMRSEHVVLLAFADITERLAREHQLARTEQALREANRRKDEFLGMLSHELRNPLGPINGSLFILDHVDPASPQARDARAIIERQVTHLTRLVDDLLDVTRIARGKIELQRERVQFVELVRQAVEDHRATFETHGIILETRFGPEPLWLDADPTRLVQIASNLLGNAAKFTPAGGSVVVSLERRVREVALCVRDTGVGIAPELLGRLFEPFSQAPQTLDRSRGGLGLGLATVRGLTELHGGAVEIASEGPGRGTEVIVVLPLASAPAEEAPASTEAAGPSRRVLVIDDSLDVTQALTEALRIMGHDVRAADRGAAGIEVARTFRPETVVCDLGLPGMDGYAVAAAFRGDAVLRDIQLIALSGYARPEDRRRAAEAGFDHHVAKPPDLAKLRRLIADGTRAEPSSPSQHPEEPADVRAAASS